MAGLDRIVVVARDNDRIHDIARAYKVDMQAVLDANKDIPNLTSSIRLKQGTQIVVPIDTTKTPTKFLMEHVIVQNPKSTWARIRELPFSFAQFNPRRKGTKSYEHYDRYKAAKTPNEYLAIATKGCKLTKSEAMRNWKWVSIAGYATGAAVEEYFRALIAKESALTVTPPDDMPEGNTVEVDSEDERAEKSMAQMEEEAGEALQNLFKKAERPMRQAAVDADWSMREGPHLQEEELYTLFSTEEELELEALLMEKDPA